MGQSQTLRVRQSYVALFCVSLNILMLFFPFLQTEDKWENDDKQDIGDDNVLTEVDIPKLPNIVYDPQSDDAPGIG